MDIREKVRSEFTRQAEPMATAPALQDAEVVARIVEALGPSTPGRILDLACGPGIVSEALAPLASELVGVDITPKMVELARNRLAEAGVSNARFQVAPAEALPFAAAEFDTVVTRLSIHHFQRPEVVLTEVRRVLRPSGRLVVADILSSSDPGDSALHNALERLRDPTHMRMLAREEFTGLFEAAGFALVQGATWEQERAFSEWSRIVADASRTQPLQQVMRALARAGVDAGIRLRESAGEVRFTHTWFLAVARPTSELASA